MAKPKKGGWDTARASPGYVVSHPEARKGKSAEKVKPATTSRGEERRPGESEQRVTKERYRVDPQFKESFTGERAEARRAPVSRESLDWDTKRRRERSAGKKKRVRVASTRKRSKD